MDRLGKLFIKASLVYLGLGVIFGLHMALADHGAAELRFIHVHVMLLGFMAMLIYGVGYHILPRFNARPLPFPSLVPVQFWMANIGLVGMSVLYAMGAFYETGGMRMLFGLFGALEGAAIFIFIVNMWSVLKNEVEPAAKPAPAPQPPAAEKPAEPEQKAPEVKLSPSMKIAEILEKYPHLEEGLIEEGFADVANPAARNSIAKMVTLEMAAKKAGKEVFPLLARLEGKQLVKADDDAGNGAAPKPSGQGSAESGITRGELATAKTKVGPLLEVYPETKTVFATHYGESCFSCPGQATETIEQTAGMHGMPPQKILDEINAIIKTAIN